MYDECVFEWSKTSLILDGGTYNGIAVALFKEPFQTLGIKPTTPG